MVRSQIYLTKIEKTQLNRLSRETGRSQSQLIREAIDYFIEMSMTHSKNKLTNVKAIKGMWQDRNDLPDFKQLRDEFDRDK
jgi:ribbon-helix-helix CopG family protein